jgi:hypothetical protein
MEKICFLCHTQASATDMVVLLCDHNLCMGCAGKRLRLQKNSGKHEATCSLCGEHSSIPSDVVAAIRIHNSQNKLALISPKKTHSPGLPVNSYYTMGQSSMIKPKERHQKNNFLFDKIDFILLKNEY